MSAELEPWIIESVVLESHAYVRAHDVTNGLRVRAGQLGGLAERTEDGAEDLAYRAMAQALNDIADELDMATLGRLVERPEDTVRELDGRD